MIIKKKYAKLNKVVEEVQISKAEEAVVSVEDDVSFDSQADEDLNDDISENIEEFDSEEIDDDFNFDIDNIKFDQRQERREGMRRRGYRRSQDRVIVSRAQMEAESIKENAKKDGYNQGLEDAKADLEQLKSNFEEFFNYKTQMFDKLSGCIMDVAVSISQKILNKEVEADSSYILPIIKGVLEEVNQTENKIILKVMPKDVEIVRDNVSEIFSGNYFEAKISVVPDNEIKNGGVKVETSNGLIDATIDTQISIIEKALKKQQEER